MALRLFRILTTLGALSLLATAPAPADILVFTNGDQREGRVEEAAGSPDQLIFITALGRLQIPRSRVSNVVEHDDATDYALLGRQYLDRSNFTQALQMFEQALGFDPEHIQAMEGLAEAQRGQQQLAQERDRQARDEGSQLVETARQRIAAGKFEEAEQALARAGQRPLTDAQKASVLQTQRDLYVAWGLARLDRLDNGGAETYLTKALEIDPDNREAKDALLRVHESNPAKRAEVLQTYLEKLEENPDDVNLNQRVADLLLQARRYEEAITPLMRLRDSSSFRTLKYDQRLLSAMNAVAQARAAQGDIDGALQLYSQRQEIFPDEDPTPILYLEYVKHRNGLDAEDWAGQGALLKDLVDKGLRNVAVEEAAYILSNDPTNTDAQTLLREEAVSDLTEIQTSFQSRNFIMARELARKFPERHARFTDLVSQASDLYTKANLEAQANARQMRQQAQAIAERGDQYYFDGRRYSELMANRDVSSRTQVLSYKQEAIKFTARAIESYTIALQMDPSLGPITGADLHNKLADARTLYGSLTARPNPPARMGRRPAAQPSGRN